MNAFKRAVFVSFLLFQCACYYDDVENNTLEPGEINYAQIKSEARGTVRLQVYLPPTWNKDTLEAYPLIIYLHGQFGDEHSFFFNVNYRDLNRWVNTGEVPPFVLVSADCQSIYRDDRQWSSNPNETFLTSDEDNELRAFCLKNFNAGGRPEIVSIHGQSTGARGAVHYGLKFPDRFASAVSNAFVSDYAIEEEQLNAFENRDQIISSGIRLRLVIGSLDQYYLTMGRKATYLMHDYLESLGIQHEFEILSGATHFLYSIWNCKNGTGMKNGLYELKLHASAWNLSESGGTYAHSEQAL